MTDDILLTPEQSFYALNHGYYKWVADDKPSGKRSDYEREAICRAQVAKVTEWAEAECHEHPTREPFFPVRADCPLCWQALRAAGGVE